MEVENIETSIKKSRLFMAIIFITTIGSYAGWFYFKHDTQISINSSSWGAFGDFVGGILNPLVAFSAFYWLTVSILIQKEELSKTTKALIEASKAQQEQAATQSRQRFEGTFFQLLSLHQEIVKSIDLYNPETQRTIHGRDCFKVFYERFINQYDNTLYYSTHPNEKYLGQDLRTPDLSEEFRYQIVTLLSKVDTIDSAYNDFYEKNQSEIGHYFRSLYNISKFIHTSDIENKRLYSNLLRAQLSVDEMALLFYNCLSDLGRKKFKPLIEEYSLLKGIPNELLIDPPRHKQHYKISAFEKTY